MPTRLRSRSVAPERCAPDADASDYGDESGMDSSDEAEVIPERSATERQRQVRLMKEVQRLSAGSASHARAVSSAAPDANAE